MQAEHHLMHCKLRTYPHAKGGFTLIEILIAILIFSLGLIAAFTLISTATALSTRSKQEIIATNLLREQIEIIKNIRDTNFLALREYNSLTGVNGPCTVSPCMKIDPGYWIVGLKYALPVATSFSPLSTTGTLPSTAPNWNSPSLTDHKGIIAIEAAKPLVSTSFRYCIDALGRYRQGSICATPGMTLTPYYWFMLIRPVVTRVSPGTSVTTRVDGALEVTAYFATTEGGYRELSMSTIITDFKK
jgi:prepilin-type N-terminal cleavage/methylation domain-containing protein